jgi:hypothetical protein
VPGVPAVKLSVVACMPADVGLPRNHAAEPGKAGRAVSIGIHEDLAPLAVITRPLREALASGSTQTQAEGAAPAGTSALSSGDRAREP